MSTILDQIRENIETDLVDDALTRLIDDAVEEVESRFGNDDPITKTYTAQGRRHIRLQRPAQSITSVTERTGWASDPGDTVLTSGDYELRHGGRLLTRLSCCWARTVDVTYVPIPEKAARDRVVIDLVKLALTYSGQVHSESVGDYSASGNASPDTYQRERENLLRGIANRRGFRFA